jgi:amidase
MSDLVSGAGPPADPLGAFLVANHAALPGAPTGSLAGLSFAAKDVFDIAGHRTGFGNPTWLATHEPATATAPAVQRLLDAGAALVGRTVTDELTYSLTGENVHYGTPRNPRCAERVPGGSSSGSVAAVAGGLVDVALGTDCAGSVRLPASYCGVFGFRPTHGRVPLAGVVPFAASFDTIGWFARDGVLLERVGRTLLDDASSAKQPRRLLVAADAFALVEPVVAASLVAPLAAIETALGVRSREMTVSSEGLARWMEIFRTIQAAEIWASHGAWIAATKPEFGPGIRERFAWASTVMGEEVTAARRAREAIIARLDALLGEGDVLCLPTSPRIAPLRNSETTTVEVAFRHQAMCLLSIAGLGGLPQVSLPLATFESCPLGLSLIARRGADETLLAIAAGVGPLL